MRKGRANRKYLRVKKNWECKTVQCLGSFCNKKLKIYRKPGKTAFTIGRRLCADCWDANKEKYVE